VEFTDILLTNERTNNPPFSFGVLQASRFISRSVNLNKPHRAAIVQYTFSEKDFQVMLNRAGRIRFMQAVFVPAFFLASASGQIQFDRPKSEKPLPNPSVMSASRDELLTITKQLLETREIPLDKEDCSPTNGECTLVSKPVIFIKGIQTRSQLEHYCEVPAANVRNWSRGRYVLRIQISPASTKTSQVGIYARFEGMSEGLTGSQWVQLNSKGEFEDKLLRCIQDRLRGGNCENIFPSR
jgi:hypothetical protein